MRDTPNVDAILAIDNNAYKCDFQNRIEDKIFYGVSVKCFFFDSKLHDDLGLSHYTSYLFSHEKKWADVQWANGDYRFYYVKSHFPNYDYYWHIEYDVFCNAPTYEGFLKKFANNNSDCLSTHLRSIDSNYDWAETKDLQWIYSYEQLYAIFFPAVRLSARAIDFLYQRRLYLSEIFHKFSGKNQWVFCEIFVPTELINNGFTCANIENQRCFLEDIYLNDEVFFRTPDNNLYHPIKRISQRISDLALVTHKVFFTALKALLKQTKMRKFPINIDKNFETLSIKITDDESIKYTVEFMAKPNLQNTMERNSVVISLQFSKVFATVNLEDFSKLTDELHLFYVKKTKNQILIYTSCINRMDDVEYIFEVMKILIENSIPIIEKSLLNSGMHYEEIVED